MLVLRRGDVQSAICLTKSIAEEEYAQQFVESDQKMRSELEERWMKEFDERRWDDHRAWL